MATYYTVKLKYNSTSLDMANKELEFTGLTSISMINRTTGTVEYKDDDGFTVWVPFSSLVYIKYNSYTA